MRQRRCGFLVVFLLMFSLPVFSQQKKAGERPLFISTEYRGKIPALTVRNNMGIMPGRSNIVAHSKRPVDSCAPPNLYVAGPFKLTLSIPAYIGFSGRPLFSPLNGNEYTLHSGWFCRKEWQLEKTAGIPFRFRLGSLDYVNWLEQKPNTIKPQ